MSELIEVDENGAEISLLGTGTMEELSQFAEEISRGADENGETWTLVIQPAA